MPDLQQIENFRNSLLTIGNELEVLSERGEPVEVVEPPEENVHGGPDN